MGPSQAQTFLVYVSLAPQSRSLEVWRTAHLEPLSSEISGSRNACCRAPQASASTAQSFLGKCKPPLSSAGTRPPPVPPDEPSSQTNAGCENSPWSPGHGAEGLVWPPEAGAQEGCCQTGVNNSPAVLFGHPVNRVPSASHSLSCTCSQRCLWVV